MKKLILALTILSTLGCKAPEAQQSTTPSQPSPEPMLKTEGCSVHKTKGVVKIECADGSSAEAGVPQYHIKDASGTELDDLMFLQNWSQVGVLAINKRSGNILSYDSGGNITKINRTLFTSGDCSGTAYAFFSDFIVRNKVMANNGAAPGSVEAFRVMSYDPTTLSFNSKFEGGVCSSHVGSASGATIVEATELDDTDPIAIGLPIEIVITQ
jgi:hypothetical protein